MLSLVVYRLHRRVAMQLNLIFRDLPSPSPSPTALDSLEPEQVDAVLEVLIRLIAQTAQPELAKEDNDDE
jgi:hypothetical protein